MQIKTTVAAKEIPVIADALRSAVGYNRDRIEIGTADSVSLQSPSGDGYRAFAVSVELSTGKYRVMLGSWGGSNIFATTAVDDHPDTVPIPPGIAVARGTMGGTSGPWLQVWLNPVNATKLIGPDPAEGLTGRQRAILSLFHSLNSRGRKEEISRQRVTDLEISELVESGHLKRNKRGSISVTIAGENARLWRFFQHYDWPND